MSKSGPFKRDLVERARSGAYNTGAVRNKA